MPSVWRARRKASFTADATLQQNLLRSAKAHVFRDVVQMPIVHHTIINARTVTQRVENEPASEGAGEGCWTWNVHTSVIYAIIPWATPIALVNTLASEYPPPTTSLTATTVAGILSRAVQEGKRDAQSDSFSSATATPFEKNKPRDCPHCPTITGIVCGEPQSVQQQHGISLERLQSKHFRRAARLTTISTTDGVGERRKELQLIKHHHGQEKSSRDHEARIGS